MFYPNKAKIEWKSFLVCLYKKIKDSEKSVMFLFWRTFITAFCRHFLLTCRSGFLHELPQLLCAQCRNNYTQTQELHTLWEGKETDQLQVVNTRKRHQELVTSSVMPEQGSQRCTRRSVGFYPSHVLLPWRPKRRVSGSPLPGQGAMRAAGSPS